MKNNSLRHTVCSVLFLFFAFIQSPSAFGELRKWNRKMQELGQTFSDVLPELADSTPVTPANKKQMEKAAKKLMELAHTMKVGALPPDADPTLGFVAELFERDVKSSYQALQAGHVPYAKATLRRVAGYCIACHGRHDQGPDFPSLELSPKLKTLTPMQRGELFFAMRRFDDALQEFEKMAADTELAKTKPIEWGRAVRQAFTIAVRVKRDPEQAAKILTRVTSLPEAPGFYSANIPAWQQSIAEWRAEKPKELNSEEALFAEAARLTNSARAKQGWALDHSADVLFLRSSALAHELLAKYPSGKRTAETLLLAGAAYDTLEDRLTGPLSELYYESCIRKAPHTPTAALCFQRYESNILFGYTGSLGLALPNEAQVRLKELKVLAHPTKPG